VTPALDRLAALQALDLRIRGIEAAIAALPARERAAAERVAAARGELARHQDLLRAHEVARRTGEREADQLAAEEKRFRAQSAMVKTNEELKALQHEIDAAQRKRSEIETAVLERLEQEEDARARGSD
jgi:predicted  nucleic acid-binding Zn-ribbon protein